MKKDTFEQNEFDFPEVPKQIKSKSVTKRLRHQGVLKQLGFSIGNGVYQIYVITQANSDTWACDPPIDFESKEEMKKWVKNNKETFINVDEFLQELGGAI